MCKLTLTRSNSPKAITTAQKQDAVLCNIDVCKNTRVFVKIFKYHANNF